MSLQILVPSGAVSDGSISFEMGRFIGCGGSLLKMLMSYRLDRISGTKQSTQMSDRLISVGLDFLNFLESIRAGVFLRRKTQEIVPEKWRRIMSI